MKICCKCKEPKIELSFNKDKKRKDGLYPQCKQCTSVAYKISKANHPERFIYNPEINKKFRDKNREKLRLNQKIYFKNNQDKIKQRAKNYYNKNKKKIIQNINEYSKKRKKLDPLFKLKSLMRIRLCKALKSKNLNKSIAMNQYLGCNLIDLKLFLEKQFIFGMSWDNHGEWHIDHKIPLNSATTEEDIFKLCHYTNLQPLWAFDNISKGAKIK